jgi:hypothetical protein
MTTPVITEMFLHLALLSLLAVAVAVLVGKAQLLDKLVVLAAGVHTGLQLVQEARGIPQALRPRREMQVEVVHQAQMLAVVVVVLVLQVATQLVGLLLEQMVAMELRHQLLAHL